MTVGNNVRVMEILDTFNPNSQQILRLFISGYKGEECVRAKFNNYKINSRTIRYNGLVKSEEHKNIKMIYTSLKVEYISIG